MDENLEIVRKISYVGDEATSMTVRRLDRENTITTGLCHVVRKEDIDPTRHTDHDTTPCRRNTTDPRRDRLKKYRVPFVPPLRYGIAIKNCNYL